ncbi:VOC family protein [Glycomyces algeriensis]|uniref:Lactoylglutathione lyase n=1 Tax=Glycomyces algeriensis TaxID=256037 RepID=A0A9W6G8I2_9ACTN|nr:VOC family protein [Glycomyces algeriensis]MDA1364479.1 VOC family protein [Glycomyces algeriensis]MDR7350512.1 catechol 2,3-dioxygenase-like lactoylglutathione lyase family enzyme [Glycomyces algeriensis]GLI43220.1 lactoylglutathione lyase [Glycomyces algeriensis]
MTATALKTGHVGINVTDLPRSVAFYREIFGLGLIGEKTEGEDRFAFLGDDDIVLALWEQSEGAFDTRRPGLHHLSFEAPDIETVRRAEAALKAAGVELYYDGVVPHGEGAASGGVFFTDPDGTRLEIYAPTGADTAPAPVKGAPTCGFF